MDNPQFIADGIAFLLRFLAGSTLAFAIAYLIDRFGNIKDIAVLEAVWRTAVLASLLFLIPVQFLPSTSLEIETALIAEDDSPARPNASPLTTTPPLSSEPESTASQASSNPEENALPGLEAPATAPQSTATNLAIPAIGRALLLVLGGFSILLIVGLGLAYAEAIAKLGRRLRVPSEEDAARIMREVCDQADIRHHPYLSSSKGIESPLCLPGYEVCLPEWVRSDLNQKQFRHVIAHELAHLIRRDPIMLMVLQGLSRIFFFQPGFAIARDRLVDLAELQADAWAARVTGDAHGVAEALFTCAKRIDERRQSKNKTIQWGLAMTGNPTILKARVQKLVTAPPKRGRLSALTLLSLASVAAVMVVSLPGIEFSAAKAALPSLIENELAGQTAPSTPKAPETEFAASREFVSAAPSAREKPKSVKALRPFDSPKNNGNISYRTDGLDYTISFDGIFDIAVDLSGVVYMAPDADLRISHTEDGVKRTMRYWAEDGEVVRKFKQNGRTGKITSAVEKWETETLTFMVARHGMAAEQYVRSVYAKEGSGAVFDLAKNAVSDYARRRFLGGLTEVADLSERETRRYVKLASGIDSDYEKRLAFVKLFDVPTLSNELGDIVIEAATDISSDYETRLLVTAALDRFDLGKTGLAFLPRVAKTIDSDYELRLMVTAMLNEDLDLETAEKLIYVAADSIGSDYEMRLLLQHFVSSRKSKSPRIAKAAITALDTIGSDYEARLALQKIVSQTAISKETTALALAYIGDEMGSDFERRLALKSLRRVIAEKEWTSLYAPFNRVWEDLGEYERGQVKPLGYSL